MTDRLIVQLNDGPRRIVAADWPVIASATWHRAWDENPNPALEQQDQGQGASAAITVREHADGRFIVYGKYEPSELFPGDGEKRWAGGDVYERGLPYVEAIRWLAQDSGIPDHVVREVIADLPPEDLE